MKNEITTKDHINEGQTRTDEYEGQKCGSHCHMIPLILKVMVIMATTTANVAVTDHHDGDVHHDD